VNETCRARLRTLLESGGAFPVETSRICVQGPDTIRYLNGQLTMDVRRLPAGQARSALLLTAKGRLCAPLWIWKDADVLILEVGESLLQETLDRLEKYLVADDVTLSVLPDNPRRFHIFGGGPFPENSLRIPRLQVEGVDADHVPEGLLLATPDELEFLHIVRGIPRWGHELDAHTLPQEACLETQSVDFNKGCYVGQEVVSRLQSVGRVNRRLFAFVGQLAQEPAGRLSLELPDQPGKPVGTLTSRCEDLELAQTRALGYLNREFETFHSFAAVDASGNALGKFDKHSILT